MLGDCAAAAVDPDHSEAVAEAASHSQAHELFGQQCSSTAHTEHTPWLVEPVLCGSAVGIGSGGHGGLVILPGRRLAFLFLLYFFVFCNTMV